MAQSYQAQLAPLEFLFLEEITIINTVLIRRKPTKKNYRFLPDPVIAEPLETIDPELLQESVNGTEIMTPLLVPIHNRLEEMSKLVIRTKENPNFPVPKLCTNQVYSKNCIMTVSIANKIRT